MRNRTLSFFLLLLLFLPGWAFAQTNDACFGCHEDKSLTMTKKGKTIGLSVNPQEFNSSVHKDMECVSCHVGFDAAEMPHAKSIKPVDCGSCHEAGNLKKSVHGMALASRRPNAPTCASCHTAHNIRPAAKMASDIGTCLTCHNTPDILSYKQSKHFALRTSNKVLALGCKACHGGAHDILSMQNPTSRTHPGQSAKLCMTCHPVTSAKFRSSVHHSAILTKNGVSKKCTDCHGAHGIFSASKSQASKGCLSCHLDQKKLGSAKNSDRLVQFAKEYVTSVHGRISSTGREGASCVDCHGDHVKMSSKDPAAPTRRENIPAMCGRCHAQAAADFAQSSHGQSLQKGGTDAPVCTDCHGEHGIGSITSGSNPVSRKNESKVCMKCHAENADQAKNFPVSRKFMKNYTTSVHGLAVSSGNLKAAVCSDCHTGHKVLSASNPQSTVNKANISSTCGAGSCHPTVKTDYVASVHGMSLARGQWDNPTCTDCHGQHDIIKTTDERSPVFGSNLAKSVCLPCHAKVQMAEKYGITSNPADSYLDSYHGLALSGGSKVAANCASCHGVHNIRSSADPASLIHPDNLQKTCGKCHPNSTENFVKGGVHVVRSDSGSGLRYTISTMYIILIVLTIGFMGLHNLLDFLKKSRHNIRQRRAGRHSHAGHGLYVRMTLSERLQHFSLMSSFILLVLTGFGLTYPNSWWVQIIRTYGGDWAFELRGILHRVAAVVMIAASLYHVYYLAMVPRGRQLFKDLLPKVQDAWDLLAAMKYYVGLTDDRPRFDRFSYIEKAEYWALIWGTVVMVITGFMLWFHEFFGAMTSKLVLDIAEIVHFYEAWLATLAIIVWHLYFVIFNPDVYPMNVAWIKGTITEHEMEDEHPLELERIKAQAANVHIDTTPVDDSTEQKA